MNYAQRIAAYLLEMSAGQDATEAFYGLHRHEILQKPQYQRLQIGVIEGEEPSIHPRAVGELSKVPYGEPTWLTPGYFSPYFSEVRHFSIVNLLVSLLHRTTDNCRWRCASS